METTTLTPPQKLEVIKALQHNANRIGQRMRRTQRRIDSQDPEILARFEESPEYKAYLEALVAARQKRIENILALIGMLDQDISEMSISTLNNI